MSQDLNHDLVIVDVSTEDTRGGVEEFIDERAISGLVSRDE